MTTVFLEKLEFDRTRMRESLSMGHLDATLRMERLVAQGMPLRRAHEIVAAELGSARPADTDCNAYQTLGSAHPDETQRVAEAILASLDSPP